MNGTWVKGFSVKNQVNNFLLSCYKSKQMKSYPGQRGIFHEPRCQRIDCRKINEYLPSTRQKQHHLVSTPRRSASVTSSIIHFPWQCHSDINWRHKQGHSHNHLVVSIKNSQMDSHFIILTKNETTKGKDLPPDTQLRTSIALPRLHPGFAAYVNLTSPK